MEEEEFTRAIYWKILYSAVSIGFAAFTLILYLSDHSKVGPWFLFIPFVFFIFATIVVIKQVRSKFIISADYIKVFTTFQTKELLTANVKGFRIASRYIVIEPISIDYARIVINNFDDYTNIEYLTNWLRENFTDLDEADLAEEKLRFLKDPDFGSTEKEHEEKLKSARQVAIFYNVAGAIIGFPMIFFDNLALTILSLIYPLVGIVVMKFSGGLIKFISNKKRSVYPWVMFGFYIPALTLFITGLLKFDILKYGHIWIIAVPIGVIVFFLLYVTGFNKNTDAVKGQIIFMLVLSCFYSYGSTIQVNCTMDKTSPTLIHTKIYNKYTDYNKRTHYHFKLKSWDDDPTPKDIEVSQARFNRYLEGDGIEVYLRKGFLNIPWYTLYN